MQERRANEAGIGAGCLFGVATFSFVVAAQVLQTADLGTALVLAAMGAFPAWLGWAILQQAKKQAKELDAAQAARVEKQVLALAAGNHGVVTPAMVTMRVAGVSVAAAKKLLEQLAADGFCGVETDDQGRILYRFPVGETAVVDESDDLSLSPEEWVRRMGGTRQSRMTGEDTRDRGVSEDLRP